MLSLAGKTIVVTGAANGIGRKTAAFLAKCGAKVLALDNDSAGLSHLQECPSVTTYVVDVTDPAAVQKWAESVDGEDIHVLFNNVGVVVDGTILDSDLETWNRTFAVNVTSMYLMIHAILPKMLSRKIRGSIINMASIASSVTGVQRRAVYGATKGAVVGLTKGIAVDYLESGIVCNALCPGPVETDAFRERRADPSNSDQSLDEFVRTKLLGRLVSEDEVASAAAYLASDYAASMTGTTITMDAGACLFKY